MLSTDQAAKLGQNSQLSQGETFITEKKSKLFFVSMVMIVVLIVSFYTLRDMFIDNKSIFLNYRGSLSDMVKLLVRMPLTLLFFISLIAVLVIGLMRLKSIYAKRSITKKFKGVFIRSVVVWAVLIIVWAVMDYTLSICRGCPV